MHVATPSAIQANDEPQPSLGLKGSLDRNDGVDGMGAVALKDGADEDEYFGKFEVMTANCVLETVSHSLGASSNVAFLRFVIRAVGVNSADNLPPSIIEASTELVQSNDDHFDAFLRRPSTINCVARSQDKASVNPLALPADHEADTLLHLFFTTINLMIPCIHEPTFRDTYRKLQIEGIRSVRRSWLGTLNVVFALATNVLTATSPNVERAARANMYFERAMKLVKAEILGRLSLEMGMASI